MPILDAALAFALTMLLVATVVSQIATALQQLARTRRAQMRAMLQEYAATELKPIVDRHVLLAREAVSDQARESLAELAEALGEGHLFDENELEAIESVATEELLERLKRSEMGLRLIEEMREGAEEVFDELGQRWEALGRRITHSFRASQRWWTTGIAFIVALSVNIDSLFVLDSYISDRNLSASVAAQLDNIRANAELAIAVSQDTTLVFRQATITQVRTEIDRLNQAGLPLGWDQYPYVCQRVATSVAEKRRADATCDARDGEFWYWLLGIFLTAGLAGLGAPFWYDVVGGIARAARAARGQGSAPAARTAGGQSGG